MKLIYRILLLLIVLLLPSVASLQDNEVSTTNKCTITDEFYLEIGGEDIDINFNNTCCCSYVSFALNSNCEGSTITSFIIYSGEEAIYAQSQLGDRVVSISDYCFGAGSFSIAATDELGNTYSQNFETSSELFPEGFDIVDQDYIDLNQDNSDCFTIELLNIKNQFAVSTGVLVDEITLNIKVYVDGNLSLEDATTRDDICISDQGCIDLEISIACDSDESLSECTVSDSFGLNQECDDCISSNLAILNSHYCGNQEINLDVDLDDLRDRCIVWSAFNPDGTIAEVLYEGPAESGTFFPERDIDIRNYSTYSVTIYSCNAKSKCLYSTTFTYSEFCPDVPDDVIIRRLDGISIQFINPLADGETQEFIIRNSKVEELTKLEIFTIEGRYINGYTYVDIKNVTEPVIMNSGVYIIKARNSSNQETVKKLFVL